MARCRPPRESRGLVLTLPPVLSRPPPLLWRDRSIYRTSTFCSQVSSRIPTTCCGSRSIRPFGSRCLVEAWRIPRRAGDSNIPAAYTYFGQLTDHEVTFEVQPEDLPPSQSATQEALLDDEMVPLSVGEIQNALRNARTATLELDSIYNLPAPLDPTNGAKMRIGSVTPLGGTAPPTAPVPGKGPDNDLPRERPSSDLLHDRAGLIGDPRNDENLIVAQLHLAFLKAHNERVDQGRPFEEAHERFCVSTISTSSSTTS